MRHLTAWTLAALIGTAACGSPAEVASGDGAAPAAVEPLDPVAKVQAWRDKHERDYLYEWVSIAALHRLADGRHAVGSASANAIVIDRLPPLAGHLVVQRGTIRFEPVSAITVMQAEAEVTGPIVMKTPGEDAAPEIEIGTVRLVVHTSGDVLSLRVRDPEGPYAMAFAGFNWFPIQDEYRVTGRLIADAEPREMRVLNTYNEIDTYATEGVVEFSLQGETHRLRPFTTRPNRFYFVFRDASSGVETYETARFVYADLLADGTTVLDFNEAYNPPCAFNPFTTCPIPLPENRLPVAILAGEKDYVGTIPSPGR